MVLVWVVFQNSSGKQYKIGYIILTFSLLSYIILD